MKHWKKTLVAVSFMSLATASQAASVVGGISIANGGVAAGAVSQNALIFNLPAALGGAVGGIGSAAGLAGAAGASAAGVGAAAGAVGALSVSTMAIIGGVVAVGVAAAASNSGTTNSHQ